MASESMAEAEPRRVIVGVDTHKDVHVAMAKDELGRALGHMTIPASAKGYRALLAWSRELGTVQAFGVEGTGCYGAALARYLRREREVVIEVIRPNRSTRRLRGKSDPVDAEAAASAVLSGEARATPKSGEGAVEMIRVLRVARTTAIRARTQAINALHAVVVTSPSELRERLGRSVWSPTGAHLRRVSSGCARRSHRGDQDGASIAGQALPRFAAGGAGARRGARAPGCEDVPDAARDLRCWVRHGRCAVARRWRQPRARSFRGCVRQALRRVSGRGILRQGHAPPAEPWWEPSGQLGAAPDRDGEAPMAPSGHDGLRGTEDGRGKVKAGDHQVLEALRRSRGLRRAH